MPIDALAGDGLAPLHWALALPGNEIATLLLDRGASVDVRSEEGATPLMNAVQSASLEQATLLLDRGADANARDLRGFTALHRAAEMGLVDITALLLARGASIDVDAEGHTPRSLAIARDRKDILALLDRHAVGEG
jgi:ankyrin repeat protein